jgi:hypothetical protein
MGSTLQPGLHHSVSTEKRLADKAAKAGLA